MNRFSWSRSTWFAPALILTVLALATAAYFPALAVINDLQERLASSQQTLTRLNSQIQVGQIAASASQQNVSPFAADFLSGSNESLVVAGLQSRLRELAIQNNVELNSSNTLPTRTEGGVNYLGLHIVIRGEIKDIQHVLHTIETGRPLLFVSRAIMRMDTWPITSNDPERNGRPALVTELDVFGAMLPPGVAVAAQDATTDSPDSGQAPEVRSNSLRGRR